MKELQEERRIVNAYATRALINEQVMRSPRHGHAWCRHRRVFLSPSRRCHGCGKMVWQDIVMCPLCGVLAHRFCANRRGINVCSATVIELHSQQDSRKPSLAAMRYDSIQRAAKTRFGSIILNAVERRRGFLEKADRDVSGTDHVALDLEIHRLRCAKEDKAMPLHASSSPTDDEESLPAKKRMFFKGASALAGATVVGAAAGSVIAGPAGAMVGAKLAQSSVQMGALIGVAVGYRYMLSEEKSSPVISMGAAGRKAAIRATMGRLGRGGSDEPWAAAAAASVASAQLDNLPLEKVLNPDQDIAELVNKLLAPDNNSEQDSPPRRVMIALNFIFQNLLLQEEQAQQPSLDRIIDAVLRFSRILCVEFVAYIPSLAASPSTLDATEHAVDAFVFTECYAMIFPFFISLVQIQDYALNAAYDIPITALKKVSHSAFDDARTGLIRAANTKPPLAKLELFTTAVRDLARAGGDEDVDADLLLPLAVDCLRAARISNFNAHLGYIEAFCHSRDFLGAQGYAFTTLRCAVAFLCNSEN
uniref:VPS9 domain-containing protein n=1 Tax=Aureoumbra lagunensis TaxID=44058 RepID=A0A7S3K0A3_9STRA